MQLQGISFIDIIVGRIINEFLVAAYGLVRSGGGEVMQTKTRGDWTRFYILL